MTMTRHMVAVGRRRVHYTRQGDGPPVILLHASATSAGEMRLTQEVFARDFTVIAVDTPGYGLSEPLRLEGTSGSTPEMADYADALAETLEQLGIGPAVVYGRHTGASIAVEFGRRHPARCTMVMTDGYPIWTEAERAKMLGAYLPGLVPTWEGAHLLWSWFRYRDQHAFWPWFDRRAEKRATRDLPDLAFIQRGVIELLQAGDGYRVAYAGAFRHDGLAALDGITVPVCLGTRPSDLIHAMRDRAPPGSWRIEAPPDPLAAAVFERTLLLRHLESTSDALPGTTPGARSGATPGVTPGAIPGTIPGAMPGAMPGAIHGTTLRTTSGATPGAISVTTLGTIPGSTPDTIPGITLGTTPGAIHGATLGTIPGATPGAIPGITPGAPPATNIGTILGAIPGTTPGATPAPKPVPPAPPCAAPPGRHRMDFLTVEGCPILMRRTGAAAAETLLLIPELPGATNPAELDALAATNTPAIAFDLPGFGESALPPGFGPPGFGAPGFGAPGFGAPGFGAPASSAPAAPASGPTTPARHAPTESQTGLATPASMSAIDHWASLILAALDAAGVGRVRIQAHRGGATVAAALARLAPDRVTALHLNAPLLVPPAARPALIETYAPDMALSWDGTHLIRLWHHLRDQEIWWPWHTRTQAAALTTDPDIDPADLTRRALACMRHPELYRPAWQAVWAYPLAETLAQLRIPITIEPGRDAFAHLSSPAAP